MKKHDWATGYDRTMQNKNKKILNRIRNMVQSIWDLCAEKAGQTIFDQEADTDENIELFEIVMQNNTAVRRYKKDGSIRPLFNDDLYDTIIVGLAQEYLEDLSINDDLLN